MSAEEISVHDTLKDQKTETVKKQWFVMGLSGVSSGGKTTLAMKLLNSLPCNTVYISQDEYILPNDYPGHLEAPKPLNGLNKDSLKSIDMTKMVKDIKNLLMSNPNDVIVDELPISKDRKKVIGSALKSAKPKFHGSKRHSNFPSVLLLDGFLLFNHPEIPPLCDAKYFITLTKDQCWERRKNRTFTAPGMDAQAYFENCMWPKYEEHLEEMCYAVKDVQFINGIHHLDDTFENIFKDLMKNLKSTIC